MFTTPAFDDDQNRPLHDDAPMASICVAAARSFHVASSVGG